MDVEQSSSLQPEELPTPTQPEESPTPTQQEEPPTLAQQEEPPTPTQQEESPTLTQQEEPPIPAPSSTLASYSLRFAGGPTTSQLIAIAVATAVYTALSWLSSTFLSSGIPIVSFLFVAIGFGIPFAIWFGGWAFVIAYIGNAVGAGILSGLPLPVALWFGTVDLIQLGLPMLLYRLLAKRFGVDPIGKDVFTPRGFIFFLLCAVLPGNIIGGAYGNAILVWTNFVPAASYNVAWLTWSLSNIVLSIIIGSILLKSLGPVVERSGLTVHNAFN
jgi:hypothetical protein